MTTDDLDALERLAQAATPGPWEWEGDGYGKHAELCQHGSTWTGHGPDLKTCAGSTVHLERGKVVEDDGSHPQSFFRRNKTIVASWGYDAWGIDVDTADAAYIVAACNFMPALIARIRELEAALAAPSTMSEDGTAFRVTCGICHNQPDAPPHVHLVAATTPPAASGAEGGVGEGE